MSRDPIRAISLDDQGMFLSFGYFQAVFSNKVSFILLDNGKITSNDLNKFIDALETTLLE